MVNLESPVSLQYQGQGQVVLDSPTVTLAFISLRLGLRGWTHGTIDCGHCCSAPSDGDRGRNDDGRRSMSFDDPRQ